jgi:hypothetical protein
MTGLLSDPEWGEVAQKLFYFLKKNETFFISKPFKRARDL